MAQTRASKAGIGGITRRLVVVAALAVAGCDGGGSGNDGPSTPEVSLTASPTSLTLGQSTTLTWTASEGASCTATGAWMINVHASGGVPMMQAAARAAADTAGKLGRPRPLVIGVTVLTSMDAVTLQQVGVSRTLMDQVVTLADMARTAGLDGVVASPLETAEIRARCGADFLVVTPGIRGASAGAEKNDQNRTMGPAEAVRAGSSYIVVGRPIIAAADPRAAAEALVRNC
jgi:orotidine-5'-phosphate decarboxylase